MPARADRRRAQVRGGLRGHRPGGRRGQRRRGGSHRRCGGGGRSVTRGPAQAQSSLIELLVNSRVIDLEQPRFPGMPMFPANAPNYAFMLHRRHEPCLESRTSAAGMILTAANQGPGGLGVLAADSLPPMIRRGVLVDLVADRGGRLPPNYLVERDELVAAAEHQGVAVRPGDVLLVRTGWGAAWRDPDYITGGGMARSCGEWAARQAVFAVGADNMSWDLPGYVDPVLGHTLPNHTLLLVRAGILIFENLQLDELAETGAREFAFVSLPLKLAGATGSPTRPVAIIAADGQEGQ